MQAIGASTLLRNLNKAERVLVVSPASPKSEWTERIENAIDLAYTIVSGRRELQMAQNQLRDVFTLTNFEQILVDGDEIMRTLEPDIVIVDPEYCWIRS